VFLIYSAEGDAQNVLGNSWN